MSYLQLADGTDVNELYVTIPDGNGNTMRVREDYFDRFSDADFADIMDTIEPSMNGKAERQARREERQQAKVEKKAGKGGAARRDARQKRVDARQAGRNERAASGGGFGGALDKIGGIAKSIIGGGVDAEVDGGQRQLEVNYTNQGEEKKWYQNPIVIVGGVAVLGLGIFLLTKKKK
jgi:LPXTG-motif cell wall-anchored protein